MGLFSKSSKLKFSLIPSTPEQDEARNYLVGLMGTDLQFPTEQIADLTGTEQQIQDQLPSYLSQIDSDFGAARDYYNNVLSGSYDPINSLYYEGFRNEQQQLKEEAQADVRRQAQLAGISRSTPSLNIQQQTGQQYDNQILQQLGLLYENERNLMSGAAGSLSNLGSQQLSQVSQVEQLAAVQRDQEQAKLSAMYAAALQTLLAPYQYNAQIASALLNEQRYAGYTTGGGLTDLGFMVSAASGAISSYYGAGGGA